MVVAPPRPRSRSRCLAAPGGVALGLIAASGLEVVPAHPAAIERATPSTARLLFEPGTYAEIGALWYDPHQDGSGVDLRPLGVPMTLPGDTGDVFDPQWALSGAVKTDLGPRLSAALILDQPWGAATEYGAGSFDPAAFTYDGTQAHLDSWQLAGVLAYDLQPRVKLFAGLRAERLEADAAIPFLAGYSVDGAADWGVGWLAGAAYSRPEIGLRVALTYQSAIDHDLPTEEDLLVSGPVASSTPITTPQSVTLEAQTGLDPRTLLFGSVRWVDWTAFAISPEVYSTQIVPGEPLVAYDGDWWTYVVGVGRQLTDTLAGSVAVTWEPAIGGSLTTLGPYDGKTALTGALSHSRGPVTVTGAVTYGRLGDATNPLATDFDEGRIWGLGLRVGYRF